MTTRNIQAQVQEIYGVEVSPTLISNVTEAVLDEVRQWQARPLEALYPIVFLVCLFVKFRKTSASPTSRCFWHWASTSQATKSCCLFEKIRLQGFPSAIRVVQSFLQTLRDHRRADR